MVKCYYTYINLEIRLQVTWSRMNNYTDSLDAEETEPDLFGDILNKDEIYDFFLAIGNISSTYKNCTLTADE